MSQAVARLQGAAALQGGRAAEAWPLLAEVVRAGAAEAGDFSNLGAALRALGRSGEAETAYRRAISIDPKLAAAHCNLGNLLAEADRTPEAQAAYRAAIGCRADYGQAWNGLGLMLQRQYRLLEAAEAFATAVRQAPDWAEARVNLGVGLLGLERLDEAAAALEAAIGMAPGHATAHGNLGAVHLRAGRAISAERACAAAVELAPGEHRWQANLAVALAMQARHSESEDCYRRALALRPDYAAGHSNLLFALNYDCERSAEEIFTEYQRWDAVHARPLLATAVRRAPGRRLRVGYVSGDFRSHAVALFFEPLLVAHDGDAVEVFCYSEVAVEDAVTARLRGLASHWRVTVGRSDEDVADMIRADGIDVLVDLAGHSAGNRLLVFARRVAPVQVCYLIGAGTTSGLSTMDAFIADAHLVPAGWERVFSERVMRLERIPLAYRAPAGMPGVSALPALANGFVTFGYFGRPERLNARVVEAWSRILRAVPGARLVLDNRAFREAAFCSLFAARFAEHGIAPGRLTMRFSVPQAAAWAGYGDIDVALDPFPHNAGTTTIEALWMGVPVISLVGRASVGRFGACILHAVGMQDWVASDVDEYVGQAVSAALDGDALAVIRGGLREKFVASPLHDSVGLARAMERAFRVLAEADRGAAEPLHVRGLEAHAAGRFVEADLLLRDAAALAPGWVELHANHAAVLRVLGRLGEAEAAVRRALALAPDSAQAWNNLGNVLRDAGRHGESIDAYRRAVTVMPGFADAWANMAWVMALAGQSTGAEDAARRAIGCDPDHANGHNNLGMALMRQGRLGEAEAALRRAVMLKPGFVLPHSNILFCLNYATDRTAGEIFAEYREWDRVHARRFADAVAPFSAGDLAGRRLRVGYVSPDFRTHAVALFFEPLLAAHDRLAVEVFCYAELTVEDATTARLRALADHWRSTVGRSDDDVAAMIRNDGIDVLVDLAGHTAGNRLLVFARRAAPVQVSSLLGTGTTSGLSAMDAFIADRQLVPEGSERLFSETVVRLPRTPLAYRPPEGMPEVTPLPALANGFVTFGYFGRTVRLNDKVVAAWSEILLRVPGSRLVLNSAPFDEAAGRALFAARFAAHGIGADRLDLVFTSPQTATWAAYSRIDVALDPFPHNAGTTTIEALWMGVPVLSLADRPSVGRFGASILHALEMDDWVADDVAGYVAKAADVVSDVRLLSYIRRGLRKRFLLSALCDATGLARGMEGVFRALFEDWRSAHARGVAAFSAGDGAGAVAILEGVCRRGMDAGFWSDFGVVLRAAGRTGDAEAAYRRALILAPGHVEALGNLGNVLLDRRELVEAVTVLERAVALAPESGRILRSLALCRMGLNEVAAAEALLRRALAVDPGDAEVLETLGALLGQSGRCVAAEGLHRAALAAGAPAHRSLGNLAVALQMQARHAESEACYRQAMALRPDYAVAHGNLLFALNYDPERSSAEIFAEYRRWDAVHGRRLRGEPVRRVAGERLRVGYVSGDFRAHAVALFFEPLLAAHDAEAVEVFCYSGVAVEDDVTRRLRGLAGHWRSTVGLGDDDVADLIRRDGIDVLVDLAGHTAGNRLLVFARRVAAVQVCYLIGAGTTSGLSAMDAFIADERLVPEGWERGFSERVVRLPRIPLAYRPPAGMPGVSDLPALQRGSVTFGYFGRPERLNGRVIAAWSRILLGVAGSRLILDSRNFSEAEFCGLFAARFTAEGVGLERVVMRFSSPQALVWAGYGEVDIGLDPFPHNAGTTTIEALWMGVPVVSLAGRASVGRFGDCILHAVGMGDWVAGDMEAYVAWAVGAAGDLRGLAGVRGGLRGRVAASALCDAVGLARAMEGAYRELVDAAASEFVAIS